MLQIWRGSKIYSAELIGRLTELLNKPKQKEHKGLDSKLVEPYSQLVELKRAKDPLYKEL